MLDQVEAELSSELRSVFSEQVSRINYVQRLFGSQEVNFYRMRNGQPNYVDFPLFETEKDEHKLAVLHLKDPENNVVEVELWLVNGFVFSLNSKSGPLHLNEVKPIADKVEIFLP